MEIIDVVVDTQVLRSDPYRKSAKFRTLLNLVKMGVIRLHLSSVSEREFLSSQTSEVRQNTDKATSALRALRKLSSNADSQNAIASSIQVCEELAATVIRCIEADFGEWVESAEVDVMPFQPDHAQGALDAYFQGRPPFRAAKAREDFPDAFIWRAVLDICQKCERVIFVSNDGGFQKATAVSGLPNLTHCKSLADLVETGEIADLLRGGLLESQMELLGYLFQHWVDAFRLIASGLVGKSAYFMFPVFAEYTISKAKTLTKPIIEDRPTYYGDGIFVVRFSSRVVCEVRTNITRELAASLADFSGGGIDESGDKSPELVLERTLVVHGTAMVAVDPKILGSNVSPEDIQTGLGEGELALETLTHHSTGGGEFSSDVFHKHVFDEMRDQIERGDLEIEICQGEESDRLERARFFPVPKRFVEKMGERARFKIAPMPRFENWVRMLKGQFLETVSASDTDLLSKFDQWLGIEELE